MILWFLYKLKMPVPFTVALYTVFVNKNTGLVR
jgi:hypothetical protein